MPHRVIGIQAGSGRPIKRSGLDTHPHLTHLDEEIFGNAPTLDHFPAVPLEEPVIEEVSLKPLINNLSNLITNDVHT
jgi:hypothetical protein